MSNNTLVGTFSSLPSLPATLTYVTAITLRLSANFLHVHVLRFPVFLFPGCVHRLLSLGDNSFTGSIPSAVSSLTGVQTLVMRNNMFSGALPTELATLTTLRYEMSHTAAPCSRCVHELAKDVLKGRCVPGVRSCQSSGLGKQHVVGHVAACPLDVEPADVSNRVVYCRESAVTCISIERCSHSSVMCLPHWQTVVPVLQRLRWRPSIVDHSFDYPV